MALVPALDLRPASNEVVVPHAPANVEAEQALLGALLYDNAAFERIGDYLKAQHFFEPGTGLVYASTREGMIHIFHEDSPDKLSEVQAVKTEYGARTMGLDPKLISLFSHYFQGHVR